MTTVAIQINNKQARLKNINYHIIQEIQFLRNIQGKICRNVIILEVHVNAYYLYSMHNNIKKAYDCTT